MIDLNSLKDIVSEIEEQFSDIIQHSGDDGVVELVYHEEPNKYGGNPDIYVHIIGEITVLKIHTIEIENTIHYYMCAETMDDFINKIKAWLFDTYSYMIIGWED